VELGASVSDEPSLSQPTAMMASRKSVGRIRPGAHHVACGLVSTIAVRGARVRPGTGMTARRGVPLG
jgi:hypothetical protein